MKKVWLAISILILFASTLVAGDVIFVGSVRSNKFHHPSCVMAGRIYRKNVVFFNSTQEAIARGYVPCKICRPQERKDERKR